MRTYCRLSSGMFVLSTVHFSIDENKHNNVNMARPTHPDPGRFERGGWGGFRIHIDVDTHLVGIIPHYTQPQPSQTLCAPPTTWDWGGGVGYPAGESPRLYGPKFRFYLIWSTSWTKCSPCFVGPGQLALQICAWIHCQLISRPWIGVLLSTLHLYAM